MVENPTLADFNEMIARVAELVLTAVEKKMQEKKVKLKDRRWNYAYADIRWSSNGGFQAEKLRVILPDNTVFPGVRLPAAASELFEDAYALRDKIFSEKWHGLKLTVHPDGKCELDFNYDSNCASDPHFMDN